MRRFFLSFLVLIGTVPSVSAQQLITVSGTMVYPDTRESRQFLDESLADAARLLDREYPEIILDVTEDRSRYRLSIQAVTGGDGNTISLTLSSPGGDVTAMPIMREWDDNIYRDMAQQIYYLWSAAQGFAPAEPEATPLFVSELDVNELVGSTVNLPGVQLYPQSLALMPNGDVVVGCITVAVRLGSDFSIQSLPGLDLLEQGNYNAAMTVGSTPAGSLVLRPSMGRDLYLYPVGIDHAQRVRSSLTGTGPMTVLSDGSIVVTDAANRNAQIIRDRRAVPLNLYSQEYSYIPAIAAGPEGNIWAFDTMERRVLVYGPDGTLLDSILPIAPTEVVAGTQSMAVAANGDFLLMTASGLWKFDRRGRPMWRKDDLSGMTGLAYDSVRGAIYLADYMGQRVVKYVEPTSKGITAFDREMMDLNDKLERSGGSPDVLKEMAEYFETLSAWEMAQSYWQRVMDEDPFDQEALVRIDALEEQMLIQEAERISRNVIATLNRLGRESARRDYGRAIQIYEEILYLNPFSERGLTGKRLLEEAFTEEQQAARVNPEMQTVSVDPAEIFPSLLSTYRNGGAGSITVRNTGSTAAENVKVSYLLPSFMTGPQSTIFGTLEPEGEAEIALSAVFDRQILDLEEDLPAQVEITVEFIRDGHPLSISEYASTTIHRRTALIWDRSEKLAAFITPNEDLVAAFALRLLAEEWDKGSARISKKIASALHIAEGLGNYRINYNEDPASPISTVLGSSMSIDTVRFPRTTLYYRSGDCDDSTALLASLLEAAGIGSAILTTPGHVFLAFDTEEPEDNRWMFESDTTAALVADGTVWLPVETTVLHRGFPEAWREASRMVKRYAPDGTAGDDFEFIPVRSVRDEFPPLPLSPATMTINEPAPEYLIPQVERSWNETVDQIYTAATTNLQTELRGKSGTRRVPILNQLGITQARFGRYRAAEDTFNEVIELRSSYIPAYVNLANLAELQGDSNRALAYLDQAELIRPDTPSVVEHLARINFAEGNLRESRRYYDRLQEISPERADRLSVIGSGTAGLSTVTVETTVGRASAAGDPAELLPPAAWPTEEE